MDKFFPLILTFLLSCNNVDSSKIEDTYTAKTDFGIISNSIESSILDSLINEINMLDNYKGENLTEEKAIKILVNSLSKKHSDISNLYIKSVLNQAKNNVIFELDHIDYLVYSYNRNKTDGPPITGNITGYGGYYEVDIITETVKTKLFQ